MEGCIAMVALRDFVLGSHQRTAGEVFDVLRTSARALRDGGFARDAGPDDFQPEAIEAKDLTAAVPARGRNGRRQAYATKDLTAE